MRLAYRRLGVSAYRRSRVREFLARHGGRGFRRAQSSRPRRVPFSLRILGCGVPSLGFGSLEFSILPPVSCLLAPEFWLLNSEFFHPNTFPRTGCGTPWRDKAADPKAPHVLRE